MISDECKTNKRIRHCYPREEVYKKWIESPKYVYNNRSNPVSGKGNFLQIYDIGKDNDLNYIAKNWFVIRPRIIAVINRDKKEIIVSHKYEKHCSCLLYYIPKGYTIFHCNGEIPYYDILLNHRIDIYSKHLLYLKEQFIQHYLVDFYNVLFGKKTLYTNIDGICIYDNRYQFDIANIKRFIKKYKLKNSECYTVRQTIRINTNWPYYWSTKQINIPSIKQIITNKVFNEEEKELFRKRHFYTKYCYGRGISFKDVEKYYNTKISKEDFLKYCKRKNIYCLDNYLDDSLNWNTYVKITYKVEQNFINKHKLI